MKKFIFTTVMALMASISINAQSNSELKDEIGISYGLGVSCIGDGIGNVLGNGIIEHASGYEWKDSKQIGTIGLEYFHHLSNPKLAVGGIVTFAHCGEDIVKKGDNSNVVGERTRNYFSVMPAVKYSWINKENFALYSKVGAGLMILSENEKDHELKKDENDQRYYFMWQASLIGVEFGGKLRGFVEAGVGEQGIILAGIKYKF